MPILSIILITLGFLFLIKGADLLVDGASGIAKKFHIPEIIIGLTIVSIGTSMPELFISTASAINNHSDMSIGNVIGSNISNLLLILGLSAAIKPIALKKELKFLDIPICLFITLIFMIVCNVERKITVNNGFFLLALFLIFIIYTIILAVKERKESIVLDYQNNKREIKDRPTIKNVLLMILGLIGLKIGGDLTVDNAIIIAQFLHLSEKVISITIIAIGTSLPELVTSISAAIKGESDLAIGNVLGSNIFNMLLIIGTTAVINPISFSTSYNKDIFILLLATIVLELFTIIPPKDKMSRKNGLLFFLMYIIYMTSLFV